MNRKQQAEALEQAAKDAFINWQSKHGRNLDGIKALYNAVDGWKTAAPDCEAYATGQFFESLTDTERERIARRIDRWIQTRTRYDYSEFI